LVKNRIKSDVLATSDSQKLKSDSERIFNTIRFYIGDIVSTYFRKANYSKLLSKETVDEIYQDVFVYLLEKGIDPKSNNIRKIIYDKTILQSKKFVECHGELQPMIDTQGEEKVNSNATPVFDEVYKAERNENIRRLVAELSSNTYKKIVVLKFFKGFNNNQICQKLKIDEQTLHENMRIAIDELREKSLKEFDFLYEDENIIINPLLQTEKVSPKQIINVVEVVTVELINYLKKHPKALYEIKPRQFEELIAEILASYGWNIQLTSATKDGGYDIFAISKDILTGVKTSWIIECKKYSSENKVGVDIVRALYGVKSNLKVANALIATTSYFTKGANDFKASRYDIELKDYESILEWINQYRPNPKGKLYIKNNQLILPNGNK